MAWIDRGKAPYFYGRQKERDQVNDLLKASIRQQLGTSFLMEGSPGIGKTALLEQIQQDSEANDWSFVWIPTRSLYDLASLRHQLGLERWYQPETFKVGVKLQGLTIGTELDLTFRSFEKTLNQLNKPMLLIMDEAQRLGHPSIQAEQQRLLIDVLDAFHNAQVQHGFIFLIAGLGTTSEILKNLGISRFANHSAVTLEALEPHYEEQILRDFLTIEGSVDPKHPYLQKWIDACQQHTQGYPKHIVTYGSIAAEYIQQNKVLNDTGLKKVLTLGNESRFEYYRKRIKGLRTSEADLVVSFFKQHSKKNLFTDQEVIAFFEQTLNYEKADQLFEKAWQRGIFHQVDEHGYRVSVPSMKDWFCHHYGKNPNIGPGY
ncbi:MAG: ATP-binding protein [Flavobacteriaceae bacterium]|nr:ATP-binding protein [Flavobacteriaceae bacterium]